MEIIELAVKDLIPYEKNPRKNDEAVQYVANSIKEFGFKSPIIIDKDNVVVAGHTRLKAAKKLGLKTVPCIMADDLSEEQIKAFRLADNKTAEFAEWDFDFLDAELDEIFDIDMADFGFDDEPQYSGYDAKEHPKGNGSLADKFVVPPFSVLDARQGYWQNRKRLWLEKTGNLSETRDGDYGKICGGFSTLLDLVNGGTSNFDPVLAEIMFKWFTPDNAKILDPFGGEQTKGVVAGELGLDYTAVEIRPEQVELNKEKTDEYKCVHYYCGDSNNISKIIKDRDFNFCFTSPPYYDLEVYSKEDMSALGTYEDFMKQYENIFKQCYEMLVDDSFLVIKVGEIRNRKTGEYRSFVADNVKLFTKIGFKFYNDIVLVTAVGTAQMRASKNMETRKITKTHQNILVFYKGNLANIKKKFPKIEFEDETFGEDGNVDIIEGDI